MRRGRDRRWRPSDIECPRTPVSLGSYGGLWLAFTLGGTFVALTMTGLVAGLLDGILLTALGLGAGQ